MLIPIAEKEKTVVNKFIQFTTNPPPNYDNWFRALIKINNEDERCVWLSQNYCDGYYNFSVLPNKTIYIKIFLDITSNLPYYEFKTTN